MGSPDKDVSKKPTEQHQLSDGQPKVEQHKHTEGGLADHIAGFHGGKKDASADELYKEFEQIRDSGKLVQNDELIVDPPRYPGDAGTQAQGFIPPTDWDKQTWDIQEQTNQNQEPRHGMGFIPPNEWSDRQNQILEDNLPTGGFIPKYVQDEIDKRTAHPHAAAELEKLNVDEHMKWGKGATHVDSTIYQGDPVQLMDKINGFREGVDGVTNDLMKCMMTESVLGKNGDGLNKIEKLAKEFGMNDKQILDMAIKVKEALKKMGVSTNMSVLNKFIEDHGGPGERSLSI